MSGGDSLFVHIQGLSDPIPLRKGKITTFLDPSGFAIRDYFESLLQDDDCPFFLEGRPLSKNEILFLNTDGFLFPALTLYDNLAFSLKNRHLPKKEIEAKIQDMASFLGLKEKLGKKVGELSKIDQDKSALGKRFILDAPLYVILDTQFATGVESTLVRLIAKQNASLLLLEKNIRFSLLVSDQIVVNFGTRNEEIGTPLSLLKNPSRLASARTLNKPYLNVIPIEFEHDLPHLFGIALPSFDSRIAYLSIRPEHILLSERGQYEGSVLFYERMGEKAYIHLEIARQEIIIENKGEEKKVGEKVRFEMPLENCLFFGKDEKRVLSERREASPFYKEAQS